MPKVPEKRLKYSRKQFYNLNHLHLMRSPNLSREECADIYTQPNNTGYWQKNPQRVNKNPIHIINKLRQDLHHSRRECDHLKQKLNAAQNIKCPVCYTAVGRNQVIYLGECGHGACKNCLVQSVVCSALQLREFNEVETINDTWRCFLCRQENITFCCFYGELLQVRDVTSRTYLREEVKKQYREQLNSRRVAVVHPLPPVNNHEFDEEQAPFNEDQAQMDDQLHNGETELQNHDIV